MTDSASSDRGHTIDTGELAVYYEEVGQGPPLLLLHGGLSTGRSWLPVLPYLTARYRVIMPDTRGHGRTTSPAGGLTYRQLGDDAAALIRALNLKRPVVVGWSDGGQAALELAMRHPSLARALVLGGVWFRLTESYTSAAQALGIDAPGKVDTGRLEASMPGVSAMLKAQHGEQRWEALLREISVLFLTPLDYTEADFQAVKDPTLVMLGDRDPFIPVEEAVELYRRLPGAGLDILPGAGHSAPQEAPAAFASRVISFLAVQ